MPARNGWHARGRTPTSRAANSRPVHVLVGLTVASTERDKMKEKGKDMEAGKHGFSGACRPGGEYPGQFTTFSVGVFEWVPKASGKGVKRSAVKVRVSGLTAQPERVDAKAAEIVAALDAGTYKGPKHVRA